MADTPATSPEELAAKFTVTFITELAKQTFKGLKGWLSTEANKHDLFGTALQAYANGADQRYDTMRIFGMDHPVPLRDIYVRVNILEKATARHHATIEELEQFFQQDKRGFGQSRETKDGLAVINELQKIIVLGKPGAGKTTFLKYLTLQALDGTLRENYLPIFVSLKEWSETPHTLFDFIVDQFDICGLPQAVPFVRQNLTTGRCLLLLDGFDEVTNNVERAIREIKDFSDKYHQNQFVLSCRIAAFNYVFEHFTEVEMADFNDEQSLALINKWFGDGSTKAALCWQKLTAPENAPIKELAATPLLLTLLCIIFDEVMDFPPNRAELYKEAIDALLKKWDSSRSITRDVVYKQLSLKRKELMLSRIAFHAFKDGRYFFPQRYLEQQIAAYIQDLPDAQEDTLEPDSGAVLKAIEAQHGLFVERARGIYSFSHLTFQEYFAAKFIADQPARPTVHELVQAHLVDYQWQEVWPLAAGLLPNADQLVLAIRKHVSYMGKEPSVQRMLEEARTIAVHGVVREVPIASAISMALVGQKAFERNARALFLSNWTQGLFSVLSSIITMQTGYEVDLGMTYITGAPGKPLSRRVIWSKAPEGSLTQLEDDESEVLFHYEYEMGSDGREGEDPPEKEFHLMCDYLIGCTVLTKCLQPEYDVSKRLRKSLLEGLLQEPWEPPPSE